MKILKLLISDSALHLPDRLANLLKKRPSSPVAHAGAQTTQLSLFDDRLRPQRNGRTDFGLGVDFPKWTTSNCIAAALLVS